MWAGNTDLGCISIEVTSKTIHWMVEITQEGSAVKTETWDVPTLRDLTEEEESEEGAEGRRLQNKWKQRIW